MKDIRHIATSFDGQIIALAEFEKRVQIFDIENKKVISEFDTILDFGGQRIVISNDGQRCVCGCWTVHGICCYDTKTGSLIWQRKDLKKVQRIQTLLTDNNILFAQFEVGVSLLLDLNTGKDLSKMKEVKFYYESKFQPIKLHGTVYKKLQVIDRKSSKVKALIDGTSLGTLDVAFAPQSVVVSESGGPLSCHDTENGKLLWEIPLSADGHFLRTSYNEQLKKYVGITWAYMTGGDKKIKLINPVNGEVDKDWNISCPTETEFALASKILVTSDRELINIETGGKESWT